MGHVLNKVLKDIVCRFKIMTGHNVRCVRQNIRFWGFFQKEDWVLEN